MTVHKGAIDVRIAASTLTYGQVEISSVATLIVASDTARTRLLVVQHGPTPIFLGASTVTAGTGVLLSSVTGNQVVFRSFNAVYGITATSTGIVSFAQERH